MKHSVTVNVNQPTIPMKDLKIGAYGIVENHFPEPVTVLRVTDKVCAILDKADHWDTADRSNVPVVPIAPGAVITITVGG